MSYCLKCKKKTKSKNISYVKSKNNRVIQKGTCLVCGSKKSEFPKHKRGGDMQKFLAGSKFTTTGIPGELHLPGYSFCGPGTNLNKRLDEATILNRGANLSIGLMKCAWGMILIMEIPQQ